MKRIFWVLFFLLSLPALGRADLPVVHFQVETEAGMAVAKICSEVWDQEGPRILEELVPAGTSLDTVTCLVLNTNSFQRNFSRYLPDWGVGVAMPGGRHIALDYTRLPAVGRGVREVFLHEMVHALLFQVAGETWLPTWFHEGCAMHYSGEWKFYDTVSLVLDGQVPSLDRLQGRFPTPTGYADRAYRTSLLAVNRLRNQYGDHAIRDLLSASRHTGAFALAFREVTGIGLGDFTDNFASAMNLRLGWAIMLTRWPTLFVIMSLIFAVGAARKMINTRRRLAEMDEEEGDFSL